MRTKLADIERQSQAKALEFVIANTRISGELDAAKAAVIRLTTAFDNQGQQLQNVQKQASQFKAEAEILRSLVEQFKPVAPAKPGRSKRNAGQSSKSAVRTTT